MPIPIGLGRHLLRSTGVCKNLLVSNKTGRGMHMAFEVCWGLHRL